MTANDVDAVADAEDAYEHHLHEHDGLDDDDAFAFAVARDRLVSAYDDAGTPYADRIRV